MKSKYFAMTLTIAVALTSACVPSKDTDPAKRPETPPTDRTYLPVPAPESKTFTELDVRDTTNPESYAGAKAPVDAPNVVVILVDDIGYGAPSAFG